MELPERFCTMSSSENPGLFPPTVASADLTPASNVPPVPPSSILPAAPAENYLCLTGD